MYISGKYVTPKPLPLSLSSAVDAGLEAREAMLAKICIANRCEQVFVWLSASNPLAASSHGLRASQPVTLEDVSERGAVQS